MPPPFSLASLLRSTATPIDIVDVGAMALGDEPEYSPLLNAARTRLVGFEPVQSECDKLNAKAKPDQKYLPYFIGDGTERTFHLTNFSMTSSLYEPNTPLLKRFQGLHDLTTVVSTSPVKTTRLDDIPEISNIDFLKIDIQGAELDAFRGAPRLLADALVIWTEVEFVSMYKNQPLFGDVDCHLRERGFVFHTFHSMHGRTFRPLSADKDQARAVRQLLWTDAIYIRDFMHLDDLSADKLLKLAIILHDLLLACDFAQLVLQHYDRKFGKSLWKIYLQRLIGNSPADRTIDAIDHP